MRTLNNKFILISLLAFITSTNSGCMNDSHKGHDHHHDHNHEEEVERGKHHSRLFKDNDFALELQIFENGVPPQYRIYAYAGDVPIKPDDVSASVELTRLGREQEVFNFKPAGDFLLSDKVVSEPHSFDVVVKAQTKEKSYTWKFSSYEGRTEIPETVAKASGLVIDKAASREIKSTIRIRGKVVPSEHRIAHIIPRFSGVVKEGRKHIGDTVQKGEVLAIIESNESLQPFEVKSQIAGTVIDGHLIVGEFVPENQWIYIIADISEVWADFFIPLREELSLKIDQKLHLSTVNGDRSADGVISYVAPYADERSQSQLLRVVIKNPEMKFLPGMFVIGDLLVGQHSSQVTVKKSALQKFRDWDVIFRKVNNTYEASPLELGAHDADWIEVLSGLNAGDEYVSENAFLIKADILKSGAAHDH